MIAEESALGTFQIANKSTLPRAEMKVGFHGLIDHGALTAGLHHVYEVWRSQPRFGGNAHAGIHFASRSVRFQSGTTSAHIAFSIYLCIGRAQVLSAAPRAKRSGGPGGHTYYVINPPPPPAAGPGGRALRTRAGFPRPRSSRPLTTHGAPRSAAASRAATRADVALLRVPPIANDLASFMLISAR